MEIVRWVGFAAGLAVFAMTFVSLFNTLVLPRSARSELGAVTGTSLRYVLGAFAGRAKTYEGRDKILSYYGPVWLVAMLALWLLLVWASFALMMWPFIAGPATFPDALRLSGSAMFTLGFDTPTGAAPVALTFAAAAAGLGVVSLLISFLPALYSAFNRRETLVTLLDALGGSPAWGPEVLARHELVDNTGSLDTLYTRWAEWASEVSESHTTYRVLVYLRSPTPYRSWVVGLLAMLDAAAMHLALNPMSHPPAARSLMRMGIVSLREVAAAMGLPFNSDPRPDDPISLTREDFEDGLDVLRRVGWRMERDADDAWTHFRGWRVNYESTAYALAALIDAPPAPWSGPRRRGTTVIPPLRPPHREPSAEFEKMRESTRRRRALRTKDAG